MLFVSATTGKNVDKLFSTLELVASERRKRIGTGEMNRFLARVDFERASVPVAKRVKILYMTQAAVSPPTIHSVSPIRAVKLHFSYQRFLENQIRAAFSFVGTPIWIKNRARNEPRGQKQALPSVVLNCGDLKTLPAAWSRTLPAQSGRGSAW